MFCRSLFVLLTFFLLGIALSVLLRLLIIPWLSSNFSDKKSYSVLYNNAVRPIICESWDFTHTWKLFPWLRHLNKRGEVWDHKTSLTPPLVNEEPVPGQERERSCICVLGVYFLLSPFLIFNFGIVPTVWYLFFLFFIFYCQRSLDNFMKSALSLYIYFIEFEINVLSICHLFKQCERKCDSFSRNLSDRHNLSCLGIVSFRLIQSFSSV